MPEPFIRIIHYSNDIGDNRQLIEGIYMSDDDDFEPSSVIPAECHIESVFNVPKKYFPSGLPLNRNLNVEY